MTRVAVGASLDWLLRLSRGRRRLAVAMFKGLRAPFVRLGDPAVTYRLAGRDLQLPLSHDLPIIRALFPRYGEPLEIVAREVAERQPGATMIDVGANVGDTGAVMLAAGAGSVLAIEPSSRYASFLARNVPEATVLEVLLGPAGEGSVTEQGGTGRTTIGRGVQMKRLSDVLPPDFRAPSLIKLDTDGMDQAILLADLTWLAATKPILFVEYSPDLIPNPNDRARFLTAMKEIGYGHLLFFDEQGRFLASVEPADRRLVEDLERHFRGGGIRHYADIVMVTAADVALWGAVRQHFLRDR